MIVLLTDEISMYKRKFEAKVNFQLLHDHVMNLFGSRPTCIQLLNVQPLYVFSVKMASRNERIANIKAMIDAFTEKIIKNKKRFDSKLLYSMLKELSKRKKVESLGDIQTFVDKIEKKLAASTPRQKPSGSRKSPTPSVYSAASISKSSARESRRTSIVQRPEAILNSENAEENLYEYFNWFLNYLQYLRDLKNNFDQMIFYPMFHFQQSEMTAMDEESREDNEHLRETLYKSRAILSSLGEDFRELLEMCDDEESGNAMNGLLYIGGRWESLLSDKTGIDRDYFSLESEALVKHFRCDENLLNIIRLVPDIVVKGMKAEVLVKKWLSLNEKRNMDLNERLARIKKIRDGLSKRSQDMLKKIETQEAKLAKETADLDGMLKREDRWDILKMRLDEVDDKILHLKADLRHMAEEKEKLAKSLVASARKDTDEFENLKVEFEENRVRFQLVQQRLNVQLYKRSIIETDLEVELEVKPSLLRHTDHVQDRCEVIEKELEVAKTDRQALDNLLAPLKEEEIRLQQRVSRMHSAIAEAAASAEKT
jgi:hypothetical protein